MKIEEKGQARQWKDREGSGMSDCLRVICQVPFCGFPLLPVCFITRFYRDQDRYLLDFQLLPPLSSVFPVVFLFILSSGI